MSSAVAMNKELPKKEMMEVTKTLIRRLIILTLKDYHNQL